MLRPPPFSLLLLLLLGAFLATVSAKLRAPRLKRNGTTTSTSSAVQARQITRERISGRADKVVMADLFGREDCSLPRPSTGVCTCGLPYQLCGPQCVDADNDVNNCGGCEQPCEGSNPGCCGGLCSDFDSTLTCGGCNNPCESGESCCDSTCVILSGNQDNCGACGNICGEDELCCNGECTTQDENNCGVCGDECNGGELCCGGQCTDPWWDDNNCGECGRQCESPYFCLGMGCVTFDWRR